MYLPISVPFTYLIPCLKIETCENLTIFFRVIHEAMVRTWGKMLSNVPKSNHVLYCFEVINQSNYKEGYVLGISISDGGNFSTHHNNYMDCSLLEHNLNLCRMRVRNQMLKWFYNNLVTISTQLSYGNFQAFNNWKKKSDGYFSNRYA